MDYNFISEVNGDRRVPPFNGPTMLELRIVRDH